VNVPPLSRPQFVDDLRFFIVRHPPVDKHMLNHPFVGGVYGRLAEVTGPEGELLGYEIVTSWSEENEPLCALTVQLADLMLAASTILHPQKRSWSGPALVRNELGFHCGYWEEGAGELLSLSLPAPLAIEPEFVYPLATDIPVRFQLGNSVPKAAACGSLHPVLVS
jgi:hypothetical protein